MFDDLTKEIKANLYERAKGPLFFTYIFSWLAFNIRSVLIVFSETSIQEKFVLLNTQYPTIQDSITHGFLFPFFLAAIFILLYPFPARWAYHYWHWQHLKVKKIQQKIEDETPLTQEEANTLRKVSLDEQAKLQEQLRFSRNIISEQSQQLEIMREQLVKVTQELTTSTSASSSPVSKPVTAKLTEKAKIDKQADAKDKKQFINFDSAPPLVSKIDNEVVHILSKRGLDSPELMEILAFLVAKDGSSDFEDLSDYIETNWKISNIEFTHAMEKLSNQLYLIDFENGLITLTSEGRKLAVDSRLSKQNLELPTN